MTKEITDADVIGYLKENPDFLARNPQTMEILEVPHDCGGATSLIEHQVNSLKEKNRETRQELKRLIAIARENDQLNEKVQNLSLELMQVNSIEDIILTIQDSLRNEFKADLVSIKLFVDGCKNCPEYAGEESPLRTAFNSLFESQRPLCGRLKHEQLKLLFKDNADKIGSTAIIPLEKERRFGIIAIGSFDQQKFQPDMGTIFLRYLGSLACQALSVNS
ncbi:MAG: DUF484 family protein [Gammaproteobacteria bacterium]|nr:MAG: DUF484 family protein [Gammaproteobacteria bacterium]